MNDILTEMLEQISFYNYYFFFCSVIVAISHFRIQLDFKEYLDQLAAQLQSVFH